MREPASTHLAQALGDAHLFDREVRREPALCALEFPLLEQVEEHLPQKERVPRSLGGDRLAEVGRYLGGSDPLYKLHHCLSRKT